MAKAKRTKAKKSIPKKTSTTTKASSKSSSSVSNQLKQVQAAINKAAASKGVTLQKNASGSYNAVPNKTASTPTPKPTPKTTPTPATPTAKVTTSYTTTSGDKVIKYADGSKSINGVVQGGSSTTPVTPTQPDLASLTKDITDQMGGNEPVYQGNQTTQEGPQPVDQQPQGQVGVMPTAQTQPQTTQGSLGGSTQPIVPNAPAGANMTTPSIVDYLSSVGQNSSFSARKALAEQQGISNYTGSAQQNTQLLSQLRGAPMTSQEQITPTSAGATMDYAKSAAPTVLPSNELTLQSLQQRLGFQSSMAQFHADPISSIQDITKQVFQSMGLGDANKQITSISKDLEKLENKRDEEIRNINDDPWLTEGVRQRQVEKTKEKYSDEINNHVNRLQLMESVRNNAQQQAQFALGTAISIYDNERKFQAQQIQQYYDQAQQDFENQVKLFELSQPKDNNLSSWLNDYEYVVRNYGYTGSPLDFKMEIEAAGRAPEDDGGFGAYTKQQLTALTKLNENIANSDTYKKTTAMRGYKDNVIGALSQETGVSDIAAINQFQKVIDEGAVTRDQDVVLISSAQSLANQLKTKIANLERGEKLSPTQRTQMRNLVEKLYETQVQALNNDPYISAKNTEAGLYGLTINDTILGELGGFGGGQQPVYGPVQPNNVSSVYDEAVSAPTTSSYGGAAGGAWNWLTGLFD